MEVLDETAGRVTSEDVLKMLDGITAVIRERVLKDPKFGESLIEAVKMVSLTKARDAPRQGLDWYDIKARMVWGDEGGKPGPNE